MNIEKKRVFVSSTVWDLIDVRAEVESLLRENNMIPVMSDSKLEGFEIKTDEHSIETCLANVRSSDYFILILSQNYGPTLEAFEYDEISATHLEFREAVENNIPIHAYVRDQLIGEFTSWKRNGKKDEFKTTWVHQKQFSSLFTLLEEHKTPDGLKNNWYQTFSNSVELKQLIEKDFKEVVSKNNLINSIEKNRIPIFTLEAQNEDLTWGILVEIAIRNCSSNVAYNLCIYDNIGLKKYDEIHAIVPPTGIIKCNYQFPYEHFPIQAPIKLEYTNGINILIIDEFLLTMELTNGALNYNIKSISREYKIDSSAMVIQ